MAMHRQVIKKPELPRKNETIDFVAATVVNSTCPAKVFTHLRARLPQSSQARLGLRLSHVHGSKTLLGRFEYVQRKPSFPPSAMREVEAK